VIYALISDVHSNLEALRAVKGDFPDSVERVLCLGDMVGYGPDPNLVLELLQQLPLEAVAGNHDRAVSEPALREWFNPAAAQAIGWTEKELAAEHRAWLRAQPSRRTAARQLLVHGSPNPPYDTEYILEEGQARAILMALPEQVCLFGHTHLPRIFSVSGESVPSPAALGQWRALDELPALINPGSVGQPRDGNPDASYALFDSRAMRVQFRRVPYDAVPTQQKILEAGLPAWFARRLNLGI
jgi:predicted phosphodiesterase